MTKTVIELDLDTDLLALHADGVAVHGGGRRVLAPTTLSLRTGEVVVAVGEPGPAHTALALALGGRLQVDAGDISLGGVSDMKSLQRVVALVDVPGVSEPDDEVPLATVVGEEMSMAKLRAGRRSVRTWLRGQSIDELADLPFGDVPPAVRTRVLAGLAACRDGVRFLAMVLPERHGGAPQGWMATADALAGIGFGVLVTASPTAAAQVDESLLEWIGSDA